MEGFPVSSISSNSSLVVILPATRFKIDEKKKKTPHELADPV